jgi:hypothetical protein
MKQEWKSLGDSGLVSAALLPFEHSVEAGEGDAPLGLIGLDRFPTISLPPQPERTRLSWPSNRSETTRSLVSRSRGYSELIPVLRQLESLGASMASPAISRSRKALMSSP